MNRASFFRIVCVAFLFNFTWPAAAKDGTLPPLRGVNFAGAEFGKIPGRLHWDYTYPERSDLAYFISKRFNVIRLPFRWERVQPRLMGALSMAEIALIDLAVASITSQNAHIILDLHNYGHYNGHPIGSSAVPIGSFVDVWRRLAKRYRANPRVLFGLMNEPHNIEADAWRRAAQAAIFGIRRARAKNVILVPGVAWSGAHSWVTSGNAAALAQLHDPASKLAFEAHQYLDSDFSGTGRMCKHERVGVNAIAPFVDWLRRTGNRGFLGEFGAPPNATCLNAMRLMLAEIDKRPKLWIGWTYWAAGAWWGSYPMSVHPGADGRIKPQLRVLMNYVR